MSMFGRIKKLKGVIFVLYNQITVKAVIFYAGLKKSFL